MNGKSRTPEGKRPLQFTKPVTALTRRTELGSVDGQIKAGECHPGTAEETLRSSHSRILYDESVYISDH